MLSLKTTVDSLGDVLVTESYHGPIPVDPIFSDWWATPASQHEHGLPRPLATEAGLSSPFLEGEPPLSAEITLSAGRIAIAILRNPGERIDLLDLRAHRTRTVAVFPGEVGVMGLDLSVRELAWARQSSLREGHSEILPDGGRLFECKLVVLSEPQLVNVAIDSIPASGLTVGLSVPANTPPCVRC